jgi:hypothetical protein
MFPLAVRERDHLLPMTAGAIGLVMFLRFGLNGQGRTAATSHTPGSNDENEYTNYQDQISFHHG